MVVVDQEPSGLLGNASFGLGDASLGLGDALYFQNHASLMNMAGSQVKFGSYFCSPYVLMHFQISVGNGPINSVLLPTMDSAEFLPGISHPPSTHFFPGPSFNTNGYVRAPNLASNSSTSSNFANGNTSYAAGLGNVGLFSDWNFSGVGIGLDSFVPPPLSNKHLTIHNDLDGDVNEPRLPCLPAPPTLPVSPQPSVDPAPDMSTATKSRPRARMVQRKIPSTAPTQMVPPTIASTEKGKAVAVKCAPTKASLVKMAPLNTVLESVPPPNGSPPSPRRHLPQSFQKDRPPSPRAVPLQTRHHISPTSPLILVILRII